MDWLAGFRQHPLEVVLMTLVQNAPLVVLGLPLASYAAAIVFLQLHTLWVHSNIVLPLGPLRHLLATPDFHQRHHAVHAAPKNFAALFPAIDRLFGTYCAEEGRAFGVRIAMPRDFIGLLLHPFCPGKRRLPG